MKENKRAARKLLSNYDENLIGEICLHIFNYHAQNQVVYELDEDAAEVYEEMFDKYNGQFNLKYGGTNIYL